MPKLFDEDDDNGQLAVNSKYAAAFEARKEREQLTQLKTKYGDDADEDDESDSDIEDETALLNTREQDTQFLATLAALKAKDQRVFQKDVEFFSEPELPQLNPGAKPMYLKDHERMRLQTRGSLAFVSDDEEEEDNKPKSRVVAKLG